MDGSIVTDLAPSVRDYVVHGLFIRTKRTTNSSAKEPVSVDKICTFIPKIWIDPSLDDSIECLGSLGGSFKLS